MSVLLILENLSNGGAQRVVANIAPRLSAKLEPELLILTRRLDYELESSPALRITYLNARRILFSLPGLARRLRSQKPKVVFSSIFFSDVIVYFMTRLFSPSSKIVFRSCNYFSKSFPDQKKPLAQLVRHAYSRADGVICSTKAMRDDFLKHVPISADRIRIISNPINIELVSRKARVPVTHEWFDDSGLFVFVTVAKLKEQKNIPLLIHAFKALGDENSRLLILGKGELDASLKAMVAELELESKIDFLGFKTNPHAYVSRSDAFVLSSDYEGFPNALLEAMVCNTPVVSTNCPSGPGEIIEHSRNGLLVEPGNVTDLCNAMRQIMRPAMNRAISERAANIVKQYDVGRSINRFEDIFHTVISGMSLSVSCDSCATEAPAKAEGSLN